MNTAHTDAAGGLSASEDAELVARMQSGDETAFEEVVRAHAPRMLSVARRILGQDHDAHDALQDAFMSAFKAIGSFNQESQLSTWLHRIVVNASLMKLRKRKRKAERSIEELLPAFNQDGQLQQSASPWTVSYDDAVSNEETRQLVRDSIDQLPETHRSVLVLRDIEGHTTAEAATLLGVSEGAIKTRLHRARLALRTLLDEHMKGGVV